MFLEYLEAKFRQVIKFSFRRSLVAELVKIVDRGLFLVKISQNFGAQEL